MTARIIIISTAVLIISACATSYQSTGFTGGYTETQLDENVFRVSFSGNGYTGIERAADFSLLRSAELTLLHGYEYFVIVDSENTSRTYTQTTPVTSNTTANIYSTGNSAFGTATTTTSGGQSYNITKPASSNVIVLLKERPADTFSYNARFLYNELRAKYGITDGSE